MRISGTTKIIPLIGYPIQQVRTPPAFNKHFAEINFDAVMIPVQIAPDDAEAFLAILKNWDNALGCSVTVPHKKLAARVVDRLTDRALRSGSVNIIRRDGDGTLIGDMTDGVAICSALLGNGIEITGKRVALIGAAGGAGAAIADALATNKPAKIFLVDLDQSKLEHVARLVEASGVDTLASVSVPSGETVDLLINATWLGMKSDDPLPADPKIVVVGGAVADVVTKPVRTPFLIAAEEIGLRTQDGYAMAAAQLEIQLHSLGLSPPASVSGRPPALPGGSSSLTVRHAIGESS